MNERYPIQIADRGDPRYPRLLDLIQNPPRRLWYRGDLSLAARAAVAVVGARKATEYGRWVAFNLAKTLVEYGLVVVSGMAYGIDSEAHRGALAAGGKTVAVLGCGVDICYPARNDKLMNEILEKGLILSEFEPGTTPRDFTFPLRNRVISGLSVATVVVEAGLHSGSLITAERAAEQGRNVYAVPGNINRTMSFGCNKLIRDGALPLVMFDDIAKDLKLVRADAARKRVETLGVAERAIYAAVCRQGELTVDELCIATGMSPQDINGVVTVLEMKGIVETAQGRVFACP
ncbi:MAG: DNA-processing protein DprA [Clostridiales Family XIII bacterium]|jgi:DNA processing protein|nr:DNA-processing protein DprA [Clostridiales Family XIII bacterium]